MLQLSTPRLDNVTRKRTSATPIIIPTIKPPIAAIKNSPTACVIEKVPVINAVTAILKEMIPAASFNKDSPSKIVMGLVFTTVVGVGFFIHWVWPNLPMPAGFALAAILCPTDAVAVSAITRGKILPKVHVQDQLLLPQ